MPRIAIYSGKELMEFGMREIREPLMDVVLICDALRGLVRLAQFKKREKHPWISATFSKVAGFTL